MIVVKKFIVFLEDYSKSLMKNIIENSMTSVLPFSKQKVREVAKDVVEITNLIRILEIPEEEWEMHCELFQDYDILSKYLKKAPMRDYEKMEIIFFLIRRNLSIGILKEGTRVIDSREIDKKEFQTIEKEKLKEMTMNEQFRKLLLTEYKDLSESERQVKKEVLTFVDEKSIDFEDVVKKYKRIKECYFDKKDNYSKEDIDCMISILKDWKLDNEICENICFLLKKKIKQKTEWRFTPVPVEQKKTIHYVTDKEYKKIRKELNSYFDFYSMREKRILTFYEILYCLSLMIKLGNDQNQIKAFLLKVMKYPYNLHEQLRFYGHLELAVEMEEILCELAVCKEEDCSFWHDLLVQKQKEALQILPNDYSYELNKAKTLYIK